MSGTPSQFRPEPIHVELRFFIEARVMAALISAALSRIIWSWVVRLLLPLLLRWGRRGAVDGCSWGRVAGRTQRRRAAAAHTGLSLSL